MSKYNEKYFFPSKYLNASDCVAPRTVTIRGLTEVTFPEEKEPKPLLLLNEDHRGFVTNRTNFKTIAAAYGPDPDGWLDKTIVLEVERITVRGKVVPSVRVRIPDGTLSDPSNG